MPGGDPHGRPTQEVDHPVPADQAVPALQPVRAGGRPADHDGGWHRRAVALAGRDPGVAGAYGGAWFEAGTLPQQPLKLPVHVDGLGLPAGGILALPARHSAPTDTAWSLGWFMTVFYILMTLIQMLAGLIRDRTGSDLVTVEFGCALLALVAIGLIPFELARRALRSAPAMAA